MNNGIFSATLRMFEDIGAFKKEGHFVYASGLHGSVYFNKDVVFANPEVLQCVITSLILATRDEPVSCVVGPAIGGAVLAQLYSQCAHMIHGEKIVPAFTEKTPGGGYMFRREYDSLVRKQRTLVLEDVLTTGMSCKKTVHAVRRAGGEVVGVAAIFNRGGVTEETLGVPSLFSLLEHPLEQWKEENCPLCKQGIRVNTELGHGAIL